MSTRLCYHSSMEKIKELKKKHLKLKVKVKIKIPLPTSPKDEGDHEYR